MLGEHQLIPASTGMTHLSSTSSLTPTPTNLARSILPKLLTCYFLLRVRPRRGCVEKFSTRGFLPACRHGAARSNKKAFCPRFLTYSLKPVLGMIRSHS